MAYRVVVAGGLIDDEPVRGPLLIHDLLAEAGEKVCAEMG